MSSFLTQKFFSLQNFYLFLFCVERKSIINHDIWWAEEYREYKNCSSYPSKWFMQQKSRTINFNYFMPSSPSEEMKLVSISNWHYKNADKNCLKKTERRSNRPNYYSMIFFLTSNFTICESEYWKIPPNEEIKILGRLRLFEKY